MTTTQVCRSISVATLLLLLCAVVNAQEFRGSITGKITDPNSAVVPDSTVTGQE